MTPYYDDGQVTIYHGDARDVLPSVAPLATALITDPPYGIAYEAMRNGGTVRNDRTYIKTQSMLATVLRYVRHVESAFVCCDWRSLPMVLSVMDLAEIEAKSCIVWDKGHGVQNLDRFAKSYELIVYAGPFGGEPTVARDVWQVARDYSVNHPTPKPVDLMALCVRLGTAPDAVVLDPFMGAGSTLVAARLEGRRAIGIELEERYCEMAVKRLAQGVLDFGCTVLA